LVRVIHAAQPLLNQQQARSIRHEVPQDLRCEGTSSTEATAIPKCREQREGGLHTRLC
jgi:hypothetical protein